MCIVSVFYLASVTWYHWNSERTCWLIYQSKCTSHNAVCVYACVLVFVCSCVCVRVLCACVCIRQKQMDLYFIFFSIRSLSQLHKLEELDVGSNELYNLVSVEIFKAHSKWTNNNNNYFNCPQRLGICQLSHHLWNLVWLLGWIQYDEDMSSSYHQNVLHKDIEPHETINVWVHVE